jgi:hypothetical protein
MGELSVASYHSANSQSGFFHRPVFWIADFRDYGQGMAILFRIKNDLRAGDCYHLHYTKMDEVFGSRLKSQCCVMGSMYLLSRKRLQPGLLVSRCRQKIDRIFSQGRGGNRDIVMKVEALSRPENCGISFDRTR